MKLISHRGNISGKTQSAENRPIYIESAIKLGYDVEVDVWVIDGQFWLGHDAPEYPITMKWLVRNGNHLWIHCKNVDAVQKLIENDADDGGLNYFWHENDRISITSKGYIWTTDLSISGPNVVWMVVHEGPMTGNDFPPLLAICTDNLDYFKDLTDS